MKTTAKLGAKLLSCAGAARTFFLSYGVAVTVLASLNFLVPITGRIEIDL